MRQLTTKLNFFKFLELVANLNCDENSPFIQLHECKKIDTYFFVTKYVVDTAIDFEVVQTCKLTFTFCQKIKDDGKFKLRNICYCFNFTIDQDDLLKYVFTLPSYGLSIFLNFLCKIECPTQYDELINSNS